MNILIWSPHLIFISIWAIVMGVLWLFRFMKRGRRTPLTRQLLRMPGETLKRRIDDLDEKLYSYLFYIMTLPIMLYAIFLAASQSGKSSGLIILLCIAILVSELFFIYKMWKMLKERINLRLALDCELAVGQELNHLMLEGCRVYHDFPADKFNIDHVVVSPNGVFAVETKGRAKPDKGGGKEEATVTYDGEKLNFPGWSEKDPLDQAKRQAVWLSKWLTSAVGEQVSVQPVLALPGWFIDRKKPSRDLIIFNGKNPDLLLKWMTSTPLSETLIQRVVHQVEQRCRDVEPIAYQT